MVGSIEIKKDLYLCVGESIRLVSENKISKNGILGGCLTRMYQPHLTINSFQKIKAGENLFIWVTNTNKETIKLRKGTIIADLFLLKELD